MSLRQIMLVVGYCVLVSPLMPVRAEPATQPAAEGADPDLPDYVAPANAPDGKLLIGGSGTMGRLIAPLAAKYADIHWAIEKTVNLQGSASTPIGLANHTVNVGLMSRQMKAEEKAVLKQQTGRDPVEIVIAYDAILILVNQNNPVSGITLPQLDALYGTAGRAGCTKPLNTWDDLGVKGDLAKAGIKPYGTLEENQGTVETFRRIALLGGPLNRGVKTMGDISSEFGEAVAADPAGISYNIYHPPIDGAKAIPVAAKEGDAFVPATSRTLEGGTYPLTRALYLYLADTTDPVAIDFVRFILSRAGQQIVADAGASSLSAGDAQQQRAAMGN